MKIVDAKNSIFPDGKHGGEAKKRAVNMDKDDKITTADNDLASLQQHIVQLEEALGDYAQRYGLTDKARAALNFHATIYSPAAQPAAAEERRRPR